MGRTLTDTATVAWDESEAGKLKANLVQSIDADTTLGGASPSDSALPTQKAIKAYVDANSVPASTDDNLGGNSASDLVAPTQKAVFTILNKRTAWSVKEFGAVGDGVTDDTTALQAALDSGEQHIWVPPGIFITSAPLLMPDAYQLVEGVGRNISVIKPGTTFAGAVIKRDYTITKQGGGLRGLDIDARGRADYCVHWEAGKWQIFEDLWCRNALVANGLFGNAVSNSYRFYEAKFLHAHFFTESSVVAAGSRPDYNLRLLNYATDIEVLRCTAYGAKLANFHLLGSSHSFVANHSYKGAASYEADYGYHIEQEGHRLLGNYADGGWNVAAIYVAAGAATVLGNYIGWNGGTTGDGIKIATGLDAVHVLGNVFGTVPGGCAALSFAGTRPTNSVILVGDGESDVLIGEVGKRRTVRAATTANITISTALNNGDALDGVTLATGDLVLVKNQSTAAENGIYVVGATPARAPDYNAYDEHPGALVTVQEGTTNADTLWQCTSNKGGALGTDSIVWTAFTGSGSAASDTAAGIVELATDAEAETGTDTARAVTPANAAAVYIKKSLLTTRGDIITRGASAPQRLGVGANDRLLKSDGTDPGWGQLTAGMVPSAILTYAMLAASAYIASGEFRAATASKLLTAAGVWSDADFASLTDAASITLDMSLMVTLASVALAGNRTLSNPSNTKNGQFFAIKVTASTSTRTLTLGANYVVAAGVEAFPISILTTETVYVIGFIESASVARITAVVRY